MTTVTISATLNYNLPKPADVLLAVEAIPNMDDQRLVTDLLKVKGDCSPLKTIDGMDGLGRRTWLHAVGRIDISYTATADIQRAPTNISGLDTVPHADLPPAYIQYLTPSRYCPSDRHENFVSSRFNGPTKGDQILQMAEWIYNYVEYAPGCSPIGATATDTFISRRGVCRDFAHLLIAFARAADVPARMVSAYGLGVSPPDFHAVVEVYLDGRWHLVDATRLAPEENLVRIAVGRDATDISFMTIFGTAEMIAQDVRVQRA
ncbi:MAG TPA: transglutaminase family protein [Sphingorhabdus sp.]|nr:transglutaminase family protein [Sphingorhabdus sp.]